DAQQKIFGRPLFLPGVCVPPRSAPCARGFYDRSATAISVLAGSWHSFDAQTLDKRITICITIGLAKGYRPEKRALPGPFSRNDAIPVSRSSVAKSPANCIRSISKPVLDRKSTRLNSKSRFDLVCRLLLEKKNTE